MQKDEGKEKNTVTTASTTSIPKEKPVQTENSTEQKTSDSVCFIQKTKSKTIEVLQATKSKRDFNQICKGSLMCNE